MLDFKKKPHALDIDFLEEKIGKLADEMITSNVVEVAEKIRVIGPGSPWPGRFRYSRTPYAYEIAMELSPQSTTEVITIMKGSQLGLTTNATENIILYSIANNPCPILLMMPNENLAKKFVENKIDPMIELAGLTSKMRSTVKKNSQHGGKGNQTLKKTWIGGGRLDVLTFNQVNQLRNISYQIICIEESEELGAAMQRGESQGSIKKVAYSRTKTFAGRRKILEISTPLVKQTSTIEPAFKEGDQRYYYINCPGCGKSQRLVWSNLKYDTNKFKIVDVNSVYYKCCNDDCDHKLKNEEKTDFLMCEELGGTAKWIPHNTEGARPLTKSYHISTLYAPVGADSWADMAQQWVDAQGKVEDMQSFINLALGESFENFDDRPQPELLHSLKGMYKQNSLPPKGEAKPLFAMLGCDVQAGNMRSGEWVKGKEPRIEASLYGYGLNGREWLIAHYVIKGATNDYRSGAFKKLKEKIVTKDFPMVPLKVFIDSRHQTDEVNKFCNNSKNVFPIMGHNFISKNEGSKYFKIVEIDNFRSYNGEKLKMYELSTNIIKRRLYNKLRLKIDPATNEYPHGYLMFPMDMTQKFFDMLTAERPVIKNVNGRMRVTWDAGGRSNEPMDTYIYAEMAKEAFIYEMSLAKGEVSANEKQFWKWAEIKFK